MASTTSDPFDRVLLMARVCELEELARRREELYAAQRQQVGDLSAQLLAASRTLSRFNQIGSEDVDLLLGYMRMWGGDVSQVADAIAASEQAKQALLLGLKTALSTKMADGLGLKTEIVTDGSTASSE